MKWVDDMEYGIYHRIEPIVRGKAGPLKPQKGKMVDEKKSLTQDPEEEVVKKSVEDSLHL